MLKTFVLLCVCLLALPAASQERASEAKIGFLRLALPDNRIALENLEVGHRDNIAVGPDGSLALGLGRVGDFTRGVFGPSLALISLTRRATRSAIVGRSCCLMTLRLMPPRNRWMIMGQWHDQPDQSLGGTWETFASNSPPVSVGLGGLGPDVGFVFQYGRTDTGLAQQVWGPVLFERGEWHRRHVTITWSQSMDGMAALRLNGEDIAWPEYE